MAFTTTDLLSTVRLRGMLPSTATLGVQDSDILQHANDEMQSRLVPLVESVNEEFYVTTTDVALVSGQAAYRLPNRNSGSKLRDLKLVIGGVQQPLVRIEPEKVSAWVSTATGFPQAFYLEAGAVVLVPTPAVSNATLRMRYFVRPGQFVTNAAPTTSTVASVSYSGPTATVTTSVVVGSGAVSVDCLAYRPPFEYLALNGSGSGGIYTLPNSSPNIAVGDYVSLADQSPLLQLPVELHSLLAQRTLCRVLQQLGYSDKYAMASDEADRLEEVALKLLSPRVDGAPKKMRGVLGALSRRPWVLP